MRTTDFAGFMLYVVLLLKFSEYAVMLFQIFGPVMSILQFSTMDELLDRVNKTVYGLGGAVVTKSLDNALTVAHGIRAGTIW